MVSFVLVVGKCLSRHENDNMTKTRDTVVFQISLKFSNTNSCYNCSNLFHVPKSTVRALYKVHTLPHLTLWIQVAVQFVQATKTSTQAALNVRGVPLSSYSETHC